MSIWTAIRGALTGTPSTGIQKQGAGQLNSIPAGRGGWWPLVRESFPGAWQRNIEEKHGDVLCYPTLYACIASISQDIGILTYVLKQMGADGVARVVERSAFSPVLRKPNHYQTQQQFREAWILSKLIQGNTYVLKQRDNRGVVVRLYVLDPCRVMPMVSTSGEVFYELYYDQTSPFPPGNPTENLTVPAREIIHDREATLHHPLVGVPPLCAAYWPAVKNLKILRSSAKFFSNNASPGGILTAPGALSDQTVQRLKEYWESNFTGDNAGKVAVVGDGLKFEQMAINAVDSQLVEQMRYSDEQICQAYRVPPFAVGIGAVPANMKADDVAQAYYRRALQPRIEHMENLLDEGLGIAPPLGVELDLWHLLRMDAAKQAEVEAALVGGAIKAPNEARLVFDLPPIEGGDSVYLQQQNYSLEALARRDALPDPFNPSAPALPPAPEPPPADDTEERAARELAAAEQWRRDALTSFSREMVA